MLGFFEVPINLYNDILHLHKLGFQKIDSFFAFGCDWSDDRIITQLKGELHKLVDYYIENPHLNKCSIFDLDILNILRPKEVNKWCGTGIDMCSASANGELYPCQIFQPNSIPKTRKSITLEDFNLDKNSNFSDPACADCILEAICPTCYGMNYISTGDMLKREKSLCPITKIRALAVAYLVGRELKEGIINLNNAETYQYIQAIKSIQNKFGTSKL